LPSHGLPLTLLMSYQMTPSSRKVYSYCIMLSMLVLLESLRDELDEAEGVERRVREGAEEGLMGTSVFEKM